MNIKKLVAAVGIGLAMGGAVTSTSAALIYGFQDDDIDFVLDPLTLTPKTTGQISVGDVFLSVFEIPSYTRNGVDSMPSGKELTGIAAVELTEIKTFDSDGDGTDDTGYMKLTAYSGGLNSLLNSIIGGAWTLPGGGAGEGAAIAMFFNDINDVADPAADPTTDRDLIFDAAAEPASNCLSLADCVYQATLGDLFQVDGFKGDPDEYWRANWSNIDVLPAGGDLDGTSLDAVKAYSYSNTVASVNFGLSNFFQAGGKYIGWLDVFTGTQTAVCNNKTNSYAADGCVQFTGSGSLQGGDGLSNGAVAHSDFDAHKIPAPATLLLLGAGMLGLGWNQRRRSA